ncbi:putative membrane protein [Anaerovibrio sp. JC8]|uniref:TM2 domain-containing protein n=1 Tax=Anaerovibrio sp. JC8 TaxID=1240085 RepID=UPI000A0A066A|nr:zinc-ribbon domain and TM2 domain-containing protein [Anaerovibrio sp. JC8]ORT99821.1 putative membrane protein [Anaerovibrio sp. JC8]
MSNKFCPSCGQAVEDNVSFCPNCGSSIQETVPSTNVNESNGFQQDNSFQQNDQMNQNYYQPMGEAGTAWGLGDDKKLVNKIAYGILAILLGGFGIHKFYSGKTMWGIIYILLCWTGIPAILALVEGIIGLTTKDDGQGNIYA